MGMKMQNRAGPPWVLLILDSVIVPRLCPRGIEQETYLVFIRSSTSLILLSYCYTNVYQIRDQPKRKGVIQWFPMRETKERKKKWENISD